MPLPLFLGIAAAAAASVGVVKGQVEKSKNLNALIAEAEERCSKEAQTFCHAKEPTELQKKMFDILRQHAFADYEKNADAPISYDWGHLPKGLNPVAARKYSLIGWGEYSFYTSKAVYYHCKKKGIHECLYFEYINAYDSASETIDYGPEHQKRCIAHWNISDKAFVEKIAYVWHMENEQDTSILEFCFNGCHEFCMKLRYYKTSSIVNAFRKQCMSHHGVIKKYFDHIKINSMKDGKIELQYWYFFPKVENVEYCDSDTEADQWEKEREQNRREFEAAEREKEVYQAYEELLGLTEEIAEVFHHALYNLFGVAFAKEKIVFVEEPDFTYEGPSLIDRFNNLENTARTVTAYAQEFVERNSK